MTARGATTAVLDPLTLGSAAAFNHALAAAKALGAVTTFDTFTVVNPTTGQLWPRSGQSG